MISPHSKLSPRRRVAGRGPRRPGEVLWQPLALAGAIVALSVARRRLGLPRKPMVPVASTVPLAVALAVPRGRVQYAAMWVAYVWLFKTAWEIPYDKPDKLRARLHVRYPIRADTLLGGGVPPGVRLQRRLRDRSRANGLDIALTATAYVLWLVPHAVIAWMLLCDERRFPRAAGRLSAVYHVTTLGYWAVPTAPPWWASEQEGELDGAIQHVTRDVAIAVKHRLVGGPEPCVQERLRSDREGGNPWGTMPSDAFPAAVVTAKTLAEISPRAGACGWSMALLHGGALVYLGEHYVTDLLGGWLIVELLWRLEPRALPLVRLAVAALRTLETRARRAATGPTRAPWIGGGSLPTAAPAGLARVWWRSRGR
ncbi:MAG TPA: phosphatase PAP2 family protein [Solirubrobacteraceae bacterium]|nr:phosphatase PAP2 family protein [Solirubrobacteraceae bacterium]